MAVIWRHAASDAGYSSTEKMLDNWEMFELLSESNSTYKYIARSSSSSDGNQTGSYYQG